VRLASGLLVVVGVLLAIAVSSWWLFVPGLVGCGLAFAGLTRFCLMSEALARMPWNRPCSAKADSQHGDLCCGKK
jgi:hypothetical protein